MADEKAVIRITAKDDTRAGFNSARSSLGDMGSRAADLNRTFSALRASFLAVFAGAAVREVVQVADTYSNLNARLALVTKSTRDFVNAQESLFNIAQQTRTGLEQTSDLFGSLSRSTEALGVSQNEVLAVTQTINQALAVSGTSAASAAAALVQLGQGFASGTLRGEELNSVLEQAPRLARAIADGMGVPIGRLRELGKEGKLTAEQVFQALKGQADVIATEFGRLPATVGGGVVQVQNSLLALVGAANDATGSQQALAEALAATATFIKEVADAIKSGANGEKEIGFWAEAFLVVSETVRVLWSEVEWFFKSVGTMLGATMAGFEALKNLDFTGFKAISDAVEEDLKRARQEVERFQQSVMWRNNFNSGDADGSYAANEANRLGLTTGAARPRLAAGAGGSTGTKGADPYAAAIKSLKQQIALVGQVTELEKVNAQIQLGTYGKLSAARATELRQLAASLDARRELAAVQDLQLGIDLAKIQRELSAATGAFSAAEAIIEAQRSAGLVADREYFDAHLALIDQVAAAQVRALQAENARLAAEQTTGAERVKTLERIADNEARIAQIRVEAGTQSQVLAIQQADAVKRIQTAYEDAEAAAQSYLDTLRQQNQRELDGMGRGTRERERLQGRTSIEDRYQQQLQQLESDRRNGLPQDQYEQELDRIKRFQEQALTEWDRYFDARVAKERDATVGMSEAAANYLAEAENIAKQTEDLFTRSFQGMEDALVDFVATGKLDFKSLADSIVADITRIIIKQQVMKPLIESLGLSGGSSGGGWLGSLVGGLFGGGRAGGGQVSAGHIYEVNERGGPGELLNVGGRQYLLANGNGMVVPSDGGSQQRPVVYSPTFVLHQPASRETQQQLAATAFAGARRAFDRNG